MSEAADFETLAPLPRGAGLHVMPTPLRFTITAANDRMQRMVVLTIRAGRLEGIGTWLRPRAFVASHLSRSTGLVRLVAVASGGAQLYRPPRYTGNDIVMVRLPELAARLRAAPGRSSAFLEVDEWNADWLEFRLPDWAPPLRAPQ